MLTNLKALIVVLAIAMAVFIVAKPICLRFMAEDDFARRRNVWFALTLTAFISPSFWLYVLVATPLLAWSASKDANPVAFYVLVMSVIPPQAGAQIPVIGINELFNLDNYRILSFAVLIPTAFRLMQSTAKTGFGRLTPMDKLILAYAVLQLVLLAPYESFTNTLRRGFLYSVDVLVLYLVASRTCTSRGAIVETMASFCLACAIFAPLALFESLKTWQLYTGIPSAWGIEGEAYLLRADSLRAQVSAGHTLMLGHMMAIAFGFWLYLRSRVQSTQLTIVVALWMWAGLLAAYSRGPWLVAVVVGFAYIGLGPNGRIRFIKACLIAALVAGVVVASPIGEHVIDNLPFLGKVGAENVTYRVRLLELSWRLIWQNPFFGSPFVVSYMESLRQGQGIIDIANTMLRITLFYGLAGLVLYVGFFLVGMWNIYRLVKTEPDPDLSLLGVNLIACMLGFLLMMTLGGYGGSADKISLVVAGLAAGYARLGQVKEAAPRARQYHDPRSQTR